MDGSSFQKQQWTSAKSPRPRISSACSKYGVEEWRLVRGSRDHLSVTQVDGETLYRAGPVAVFVRDRRVAIPRPARLPELLEDYDGDRPMMEALLDCEFSVAELVDDNWIITASTLPWREGEVLDVAR